MQKNCHIPEPLIPNYNCMFGKYHTNSQETAYEEGINVSIKAYKRYVKLVLNKLKMSIRKVSLPQK